MSINDVSSSVLGDDSSEEQDNDRNKRKKRTVRLKAMLANACSLAPKIQSIIEYFEELELDIMLVTES